MSIGQRQILALARAILRRSKLLILDEATSSIGEFPMISKNFPHVSQTQSDHETDTVIQRTLRNELAKDVTLLIVAHRLQTVMDADKIVRHTALTMDCNTDRRIYADGVGCRTHCE